MGSSQDAWQQVDKREQSKAEVQAYRRKDGTYSWRLVVGGDVRAKGTNRCKSIKEAVEDAVDVMTYTTEV